LRVGGGQTDKERRMQETRTVFWNVRTVLAAKKGKGNDGGKREIEKRSGQTTSGKMTERQTWQKCRSGALKVVFSFNGGTVRSFISKHENACFMFF
jgi:hypothetical protein